MHDGGKVRPRMVGGVFVSKLQRSVLFIERPPSGKSQAPKERHRPAERTARGAPLGLLMIRGAGLAINMARRWR
jgi:hypothetical protein